jgi:leucyl-tRNA synthetase
MKYDFKKIEAKWHKIWDKQQLFKAPDNPTRETYYILVMFAYPSGDIHMGHFRNYIIGDAVARFQMMSGKDVIHPFGWDAFGLPAENAAIERGLHPAEWTYKNIEVSRDTLKKVGISFDWSREVISCSPDYYKWTQWMFIQLFKNNLAYRKHGLVNWCPNDKTVLANEQVVDNRCERCETPVEKKELEQWYFKITDYADRLIDDLDNLPEWPENVKTMQKEWIGRSTGAEIDFTIKDTGERLPVFTTRPDTIYGVTFMAVAPESPLVDRLNLESKYLEKVQNYRREALKRSEIERASAVGEKDGVFTGKYAVNPYSGEDIQLWVADYVLAGYGTGAVMAVPAHDSRDFLFAKKYNIPIKVVIHPDKNSSLDPATMEDAFTEYGVMVNSDQFDGLEGSKAIDNVTDYAAENNFGRKKTNYKLRDWLISRQRYWGAPIPIIHCNDCGMVAVPEKALPVLLPKVKNYLPEGRSPLADVPEYMNVDCPSCRKPAQRDPDTMDTFVCSSWYYLRYFDPGNDSEPFSKEKARQWMPIDKYIGGITHATGHLIYFRFFQKFLKDIGWVEDDEPATALFNHGMVSDSKGEVMSKSKGNVIAPFELIDRHGIDVSRLGMFFTAPSEKEVLWNDEVIIGVEKFVLNRFYPLIEKYRGTSPDLKCYFNSDDLSDYDQTIKRVREDYIRLQYNTAISALMEFVRDFNPSKVKIDNLNDYIILKLILLIAPMAPHMAEEMWSHCGQDTTVFRADWPDYDRKAVAFDRVTVAVQVNGKLRGQIEMQRGAMEEEVFVEAMSVSKIKGYTENKDIIKKIYIPDKLLNIVVR